MHKASDANREKRAKVISRHLSMIPPPELLPPPGTGKSGAGVEANRRQTEPADAARQRSPQADASFSSPRRSVRTACTPSCASRSQDRSPYASSVSVAGAFKTPRPLITPMGRLVAAIESSQGAGVPTVQGFDAIGGTSDGAWTADSSEGGGRAGEQPGDYLLVGYRNDSQGYHELVEASRRRASREHAKWRQTIGLKAVEPSPPPKAPKG